MPFSDKQIVEKIKSTKHWHHNIEYIDGEFVEVVVKRFQEAGDEDLLAKIVKNYEIFRGLWAKAFAKYLDNDPDAGAALHDEIIWLSSSKFDRSKTIKRDGKAFNAYYVSACLNQLKNMRNAKMSHKNHPRIKCPICAEEVHQIDAKHLSHAYDLDRYKKDFRKYPLVSTDGKTLCPITGKAVKEITESYVNRVKWPDGSRGYYTVADYEAEFGPRPKGPFTCPITNMSLAQVDADYPMSLAKGYDQKAFAEEFPHFPGLFVCQLTGRKILEATQEYLDDVLNQSPENDRKTLTSFSSLFPGATLKAKSVQVENPYTKTMVDEITPKMLLDAGTTVQDHVGANMKLVLDKWYPVLVACPFTGRNTKMLKRSLLKDIGRTGYDFCLAVSEYPLRKWQVKCAICKKYVDNIWSHLEEEKHSYAKSLTIEDFCSAYPQYPMKATVSTNAFYETDSGDSVHISDLTIKKSHSRDPIDVEDSLLSEAEDDIDKKIASSVKTCKTMDDLFYMTSEKRKLDIEIDKFETVREAVFSVLGTDDFDVLCSNDDFAEVAVPCKDSIKKRLHRLYQSSDLMPDMSSS